jgi:hypothetical protein
MTTNTISEIVSIITLFGFPCGLSAWAYWGYRKGRPRP